MKQQQRFGSVYAWRLIFITALDIGALVIAAAVTWVTFQPLLDNFSWVTFKPLLDLADHVALSVATGALLFWSLGYCGLYSLPSVGRMRPTIHCVLASMGLLAGSFALTYFAAELPDGMLELNANLVMVFYPLLIGGRLIAHFALREAKERILLIGNSDLSRALARAIHTHEHIGIECVGFLSSEPEDEGGMIEGFPVLGTVDEVEKVATPGHVDRVVVASKSRNEIFPASALLWGKLSGMRVDSGISFYERVVGRIYMRDLRPSYLVFSDGFHVSRARAALTRTIDVAGALVGLTFSLPFLALAAVAIKLDSKGPVRFGQERLGLDAKPFTIWKLRTMREDAESGGAVWAQSGDDRVTRVGRVLRKIRLDEVPQLWNVLRGEMSLVGPRPERPEFADELAETYPYFRYRYAAKPGVTGWAQIHGGYAGNREEWEDKLSLDLYYLKYRSFWLDLRILLDTVKTVVFMRGM